MLWVKAFHIIFMVCWFAGIFYLPRLFVNHADSTDPAVDERLSTMEARLYRFVTPFMWLTVGLGIWLVSFNADYYLHAGWFHLKVSLVALLVIYHFYCGYCVRRFQQGRNTHTHRYYRIINELPVLVLFAAVILAVVKP